MDRVADGFSRRSFAGDPVHARSQLEDKSTLVASTTTGYTTRRHLGAGGADSLFSTSDLGDVSLQLEVADCDRCVREHLFPWVATGPARTTAVVETIKQTGK